MSRIRPKRPYFAVFGISDFQCVAVLSRAFHAECDDVIDHVKYNNIEASEKRITSSRKSISKLGQLMQIDIFGCPEGARKWRILFSCYAFA